jgi:hypothetical protein
VIIIPLLQSQGGRIYVQGTQPTDVSEGNLWCDTASNTLNISDGAAYREVPAIGYGTGQAANTIFRVNSGATSIAAVTVTPTVTRTELAVAFSTTSTTFVDITGMTDTLGASGRFFAGAGVVTRNSVTTIDIYARFVDGATNIQGADTVSIAADKESCIPLFIAGTPASQALKLQCHTTGVNTQYIMASDTTDKTTHMVVIEFV